MDIAEPSIDDFVLVRWRNEWFMGKALASRTSEDGAAFIKVHVHGDPETIDKWLSLATGNLQKAAVIRHKAVAVGVFPAVGDYVRLLLVEALSAEVLASHGVPGLVGRVTSVRPNHDTCRVEVAYPDGPRFIHMGNGYIVGISKEEYEQEAERIARLLTPATPFESPRRNSD